MQPVEELRYLILAAQREAYRQLADRLRPLGLTPSQAEVLSVLAQREPLSLVDLGELLVCETGSPSRLVNGLVEHGLVRRDRSDTDRRMITLTLTDRGRAQVLRLTEIDRQYHADMARRLNGDELDSVTRALWQLVGDRPAGRALSKRR